MIHPLRGNSSHQLHSISASQIYSDIGMKRWRSGQEAVTGPHIEGTDAACAADNNRPAAMATGLHDLNCSYTSSRPNRSGGWTKTVLSLCPSRLLLNRQQRALEVRFCVFEDKVALVCIGHDFIIRRQDG